LALGQIAVGDHARQQRLARVVRQSGSDAEQEHRRVDDGDVRPSLPHQKGESTHHYRTHDAHGAHDHAAVDAVHQHTADEGEDQPRQLLGERRPCDDRRVAADARHEQRAGRDRDAVSEGGHSGGEPESGEVALEKDSHEGQIQ
jgi:hypothetical protein